MLFKDKKLKKKNVNYFNENIYSFKYFYSLPFSPPPSITYSNFFTKHTNSFNTVFFSPLFLIYHTVHGTMNRNPVYPSNVRKSCTFSDAMHGDCSGRLLNPCFIRRKISHWIKHATSLVERKIWYLIKRAKRAPGKSDESTLSLPHSCQDHKIPLGQQK